MPERQSRAKVRPTKPRLPHSHYSSCSNPFFPPSCWPTFLPALPAVIMLPRMQVYQAYEHLSPTSPLSPPDAVKSSRAGEALGRQVLAFS